LELKDNLNDICLVLEVPKFKQRDIDLLIEYGRVLQPLAVTLDNLQGQNDCYCGQLLPKLIQLCHIVVQLQDSSLALATAIFGLLTVHGGLLELQMPQAKTAIIAAVSHPQYKLRWVPPNQRHSVCAAFLQSSTAYTLNSTPNVTVNGYNESMCEVNETRILDQKYWHILYIATRIVH
jgi:hypothetical protein